MDREGVQCLMEGVQCAEKGAKKVRHDVELLRDRGGCPLGVMQVVVGVRESVQVIMEGVDRVRESIERSTSGA